MKNRLFLFLFCQCLLTGTYAQATNTKPTKAETMQWIADKIYVTRTPGFPTMYYTTNGILTYKESSYGILYELDLNKITSIDTGVVIKGNVGLTYYTGEKVERKGDTTYIRRLVLKGSLLSRRYSMVDGAKKYYNDSKNSVNLLAVKSYNDTEADCISDIFLIEGLYSRMIKALKVLVEYNTSPAKDEKF